MGFWSSSSNSPSDELDFGNKYDYQEIRNYFESRIGKLEIDDINIQKKLAEVIVEDRAGGWSTTWVDSFFPAIELEYINNNTHLRCINKEDIYQIRSMIRSIGFTWNKTKQSWVLIGRKVNESEVRILIKVHYGAQNTKGLESYCKKIAYSQKIKGIPYTFSSYLHPNSSSTNVQSSGNLENYDEKNKIVSNTSLSPYSIVEQLEKLIEMRNNGDIDKEEFENLKKELLT